MRPEENVNELIRKLHLKASADLDQRVHEDISRGLANSESTRSAGIRPDLWRTIMKAKTVKLAGAAVIALVVIGGITFWPSHEKWWLGSPAAWGQEILMALDTFKSVTCREQIATVEADGTLSVSKTWMKYYASNDSYRRDIYDGDVLREIQWYVPNGDGTLQHSIRFDLGSYYAHTGPGSFGNHDPVERMRFYVGLLDEADRLLGEDVINGHQCVGFEISAGKYGNNPAELMDCIWFDVETKLPVCIEQRGGAVTGETDMTYTIIQDQFDYDPGLSEDTFIPYTPEGFVFGHPDDIQADGEKQ
jgi:hypothetical protein